MCVLVCVPFLGTCFASSPQPVRDVTLSGERGEAREIILCLYSCPWVPDSLIRARTGFRGPSQEPKLGERAFFQFLRDKMNAPGVSEQLLSLQATRPPCLPLPSSGRKASGGKAVTREIAPPPSVLDPRAGWGFHKGHLGPAQQRAPRRADSARGT